MRLGLIVYPAVFVALAINPPDGAAQKSVPQDGALSRHVNSELPSWLHLGGEERFRIETLDGLAFKPAGNTYMLQRLRLNLDVKPLPWLRFSFQAQDSRVFFTNASPVPASQKDPMDLRLGYVAIGNPETSPVSLWAGRQGLALRRINPFCALNRLAKSPMVPPVRGAS